MAESCDLYPTTVKIKSKRLAFLLTCLGPDIVLLFLFLPILYRSSVLFEHEGEGDKLSSLLCTDVVSLSA